MLVRSDIVASIVANGKRFKVDPHEYIEGWEYNSSVEKIEEIEDVLIKAMEKKKVKIYTDKALKHQMVFDDFTALCAKDSTGRRDLAGFGVITEEEFAINNNDFNNTSTELAAISLYVLFEGSGIAQYLPVAILSWDEAKKVLNANQRRRFYEYILGHFMSNIEQYKTEIAKTRLEIINKKLFSALKEGTIAAYENDTLPS